jgi:hypothetical protein
MFNRPYGFKIYKIVYDPTGLMKNVSEESMDLSYKLTIEEVEIWRTKFFAYVHEVYRESNEKRNILCPALY